MDWHCTALVEALHRLRLAWICRWAHELVDLILVRSNRVGVYCVVDIRDVLRTVAYSLARLARRLVLVTTQVLGRRGR